MRELGEAAPQKTLEERLTEQFYRWEKRGRGWDVFAHPVSLEPLYRPFLGHFLDAPQPVDDGRKHTWISGLLERVMKISAMPVLPDRSNLIIEPEPDQFRDEPQVEVEIEPPDKFQSESEIAEGFLLALSTTSSPLAFEIVGSRNAVKVLFAARERDYPLLRDQLRAFFPGALTRIRSERVSDQWFEQPSWTAVAVEFGLSEEFMLPLRIAKSLYPDPLIPFAAALASLERGEIGILQVLFEPARAPWAESILRAVTDGEGGPFFACGPELVKRAREKVARPLFAVVLRTAARSPTPERAWEVVRRLAGGLAQFGAVDNQLIPLSQDGSFDVTTDLLSRQSHRSGMLLSTEELTSLVHVPDASVPITRSAPEERNTKAPPVVTGRDGVLLGENTHRGVTVHVKLPTDVRMRHTHVIGASGTGKSTLLLSLILQDVARGEGMAVLDPHGDLIEEILARIPEGRASDVVLLDPSDVEYPIGVNVLSARSERERTLLSSDLVAIFRRLSTTWGDQMHSVFANAIQAFLDSERGGTLLDLRRFLIENEFRERFLETVRDPAIVYYFRKEFRLLVGRPQGPILTRLDSFLRPRLIRAMVAQRENRIDFRGIVDGGKVLLVKLAQGAIGEENAALLGSLLVAKLHQVAMSREDIRPELRRPFHLVIDEFHHFVTPSMAALLSAARKYRVGLTLAHQELRQVDSRDRDVLSAVLTNAATRIVFRVGDEDARKLEGGFASFDAMDLKNLSVGQAICRIEKAEDAFNLETSPVPQVEPASAAARKLRVVALARDRFAGRREEVERELAAALISTATIPDTPAGRKHPVKPALPLVQTVARLEEVVSPRPPSPPPLGRGGSQHKYLQELVKRWAEGHGYRATIEKQILDGLGSVDVALDRGQHSVACEISVASTAEQELGNIEKCLAAGFDEVTVVSLEKQNLRRAREVISSKLEEHLRTRVHFLTPEELFAFLEAQPEAPEDSEEIVGGYRVRVSYKAVGAKEKKAKTHAVSEVILRTVRRLKGE